MSGNDHTTDAHRIAGKDGKNTNTERRNPAKSAPKQTAPSPEIIAATEFLLAQPDAYLYRRRYLELIVHGCSSGGTPTADYTAAERYVLATAAACRRSLLRRDSSTGAG